MIDELSDNLLSTPSVVGGMCAGIGAVARTEQRLQTRNIEQNITCMSHYYLTTIFTRSDAAATIYFIAQVCAALFETGNYSRVAFINTSSCQRGTP